MDALIHQSSDAALPAPPVGVERQGGAGPSPLGGRRRSLLGGFLNRDPLKAAEAEIVSLTSRRDGVLRRLTDATAKANAMAAEHRRLLIETDSPETSALKKAAEANRKAQDDKTALEDAARVLAEMLAEAQAKRSAEQDRIERDRLAHAIEEKAAALAACITAEERAVQALAEAHQATRVAAHAAITRIGPAIDAESLIGELKAVSLHVAYPVEFSVAPFSRSLAAPCSTLGSAASMYMAQLWAEAEALRNGTTPLQSPDTAEVA